MRKIPDILIDIDGVLADFNRSLYRVLRNEFEIDLSKVDLNQPIWDIMTLPELKSIQDDVWNYINHNPGFVYNMSKFTYTDTLVQELRKLGTLIACTSSVNQGTFSSERCNWLIDKLGFDRHDIILAHKKYLIKADYLIDDKPENILEWLESNDDGIGFLFQSPERPSFCPGYLGSKLESRFFQINEYNLSDIYKTISWNNQK